MKKILLALFVVMSIIFNLVPMSVNAEEMNRSVMYGTGEKLSEYVWTDGIVTIILEGDNVVKGSYGSLQDAVNAVTNGQTILLKENISILESINIDKSDIIIDFNKSHLIQDRGTIITISGDGNLTIKDGNIRTDMGTAIENNGTINIEGMIIESNYGTTINNKGVIKITGGITGILGSVVGEEIILGDNVGLIYSGSINHHGNISYRIYNNVYKIMYYSNGGTGTMEKIEVEVGQSRALESNNFIAPEGKKFKAWNVDGKEVNPGQEYTFTKDTEIYALWQDIEYVASIGEIGYESLQDAVNNASDGDTIILLDNITINRSVEINGANNIKFSIDLNGKTLDTSGNTSIIKSGNGEFTIKDSVGNGKIQGITGIINNDDGDIIILSGVIKGTKDYDSSCIENNGNGNIKIYGGEIYAGAVAIKNNLSGKIIISEGKSKIYGSWGVFYNKNGLEIDSNIRILNRENKSLNFEDILHQDYLIFEPIVKYKIQYNSNGGSEVMESVEIEGGQSFTLPENKFVAPKGKRFKSWAIGSADGEKANPGQAYTFIKDTTIYAVWENIVYIYEETEVEQKYSVIVTVPSKEESTTEIKGQINIAGNLNKYGELNLKITDKMIDDIFEKTLSDSKKDGKEQSDIVAVVNLTNKSNDIESVNVNLPKVVQENIIEKEIVNIAIMINNPGIKISLDLNTIKEINKQANANANIIAIRKDNKVLSQEELNVIGNRPVFDLKITYEKDKEVKDFVLGNVYVSIPYVLGINEKAENVKAVYIDEDGKVHWILDSKYDEKNQEVIFKTNHFSTYGVGYKEEKIEEINMEFIDIEKHWAEESIKFVVKNGLFNGTSENIFSPNTEVTRGMFVTILGRLAKVDTSLYTNSIFTDLEENMYYTPYIQWANEKGIVKGIGNNKFAPEEYVTREQMAVIINNYAKTMGIDLPRINEESQFNDSSKISGYAKEAVNIMQISNMIKGKTENSFDPQGTATRAEVATVLSRFIQIITNNDI